MSQRGERTMPLRHPRPLPPGTTRANRLGDYEVRLNTQADEDDRGGHTAWEVWHWPSDTVESDWFRASDAFRECRLLAEAVTSS